MSETHPYFDPERQLPGQQTVYVRFGPKPAQEMRLDTAEQVLSLWRERAPAVFGAYLAEVLTDTAPKTSRSR